MTRAPELRQLPLDLSRRPGFSRDELVVTAANAEAVALVDRWPDWPSPVAVLAGPPGSGKSHMAALWAERAEAFAGEPADLAVAVSQASSGRAVLLDGIDTPLDEHGLFHLINAVRADGASLLMTSRRFPVSWGVTLPDLASRLRAVTVTEIAEPDDALLSAVITKLFADRQVEVEPHVVSYIVNRIERSLSTAGSVVDKLDQAAMSRKTRITRAVAAEIVSAMDEGQGELPY